MRPLIFVPLPSFSRVFFLVFIGTLVVKLRVGKLADTVGPQWVIKLHKMNGDEWIVLVTHLVEHQNIEWNV